MRPEDIEKIVLFAYETNDKEPLNGDDIEDITKALKSFNGEE
jgi:hypothetical protein